MTLSLTRETLERLGWARAVGLLDLPTGAFVELYSTDAAGAHFSIPRREALRELLVAGRPDAVARLASPASGAPPEGIPPFREILVHDGSACLFGKVLRDGQSVLLVATDPTENPGRLWAQVKVLILALGP